MTYALATRKCGTDVLWPRPLSGLKARTAMGKVILDKAKDRELTVCALSRNGTFAYEITEEKGKLGAFPATMVTCMAMTSESTPSRT